MAKLCRYGFIFIGPGYNGLGDKAVLNSDSFKAKIAAVSTIDSACKAAMEMVDEGVQLIELCGGFEKDGVKKIVAAIGGKVPVGNVTFSREEEAKLKLFLEKKG